MAETSLRLEHLALTDQVSGNAMSETVQCRSDAYRVAPPVGQSMNIHKGGPNVLFRGRPLISGREEQLELGWGRTADVGQKELGSSEIAVFRCPLGSAPPALQVDLSSGQSRSPDYEYRSVNGVAFRARHRSRGAFHITDL